MRKLVVACGMLLLAAPAWGGIFRCVEPGGSVSYQEQPCEAGARGGATAIPTEYPDYQAARDRLAAREAAADARLLKRLEIEAAERIARDERIARESELQAERERAAAAAPAWTPVLVFAPARIPLAKPRPLGRPGPQHSLHLMR